MLGFGGHPDVNDDPAGVHHDDNCGRHHDDGGGHDRFNAGHDDDGGPARPHNHNHNHNHYPVAAVPAGAYVAGARR
jgi:hypothetical protein